MPGRTQREGEGIAVSPTPGRYDAAPLKLSSIIWSIVATGKVGLSAG